MKRKKVLSLLLHGAMLAICQISCTNEPIEVDDDAELSGNPTKVEGTIPEFVNDSLDWDNALEDKIPTSNPSMVYDGTRTSIIDEADTKQIVWSENDTIGIFPSEGSQIAFSIAEGAGTKSAIFDGGAWTPQASATYSAYYPFIGDFYLDQTKIPLTMQGQVQKGNGNSDHIAAYDYMTAANATVGEDGNVIFNFSHLISIVHLFLQVPEGTYKSVILETNASLVTEAELNLSDGIVTPQKQSAIQVLSLDDVTITNDQEMLEVYIAILPTDLTDKVLYAKIYDADGICYTATLTGKNYEAGTFYHVGRKATEDVLNTGLPIVLINTPENAAITSKNDWMQNVSITILNTDGSIDYSDESLQIRGRGNSTWGHPKKPYALKLDSKAEILGMPKHKRWVLLANWMDRTLMRNDIAFHISNLTGLEWAPRGKFVEVVLNGKHIGNYYLCEQIKVDKNRVNIAEMTDLDIEGDALTGGYLLELDTHFDEVNKFKSSIKDLPYMFKEPDEDVLQPVQLAYFENYINTMEEKLYSGNWLTKREYADYMDLNTFVDWWFVHELMMNSEPYWPKSSYMHKDRLGKLKAGPVWDFDYYTMVPSNSSSWTIKSYIYYGRLFSDPEFVKLVKERWALYKKGFDTVPDYIRSVASTIKISNEIDFEMWPLSAHSAGSVNGDQELSFDEAINRLIEAYSNKLSWMDNQINRM